MKFAIVKEHRDFFQKKGWIEFEDFFSLDQINLLNQSIDQALSDRLSLPIERLNHQSSEPLFLHGRDLWRFNDRLKKFTVQPRLGEIASELIERKPLRLGYDQFFPSLYQTKFPKNEGEKVYSTFIQQTASLEAVSSLQGIACGLMISLGGKAGAEPSLIPEVEGMDVFSAQPGHALFFQPGAEVNWNSLYSHPGQRYYLIVFTQLTSFYHLQQRDPLTHFLKPLGYVFTDKLTDKLNPIVYR